ncbi:MAG: GMC family oxidoreductase [Myxococcales bacterium]|nr:GMC family oxidoreductase [Myxococcales bacterium]
MPRLTRPIEQLRGHYEVIVVGSGYGGGIAASRLARAGRDVCVLERGRELLPGDFPRDGDAFRREVQVQAPGIGDGHLGDPRALFDFRVNPDITAVIGCGVGGTSLINANVCLWPEPRVFEDPRWPAAIRADLDRGLAWGRERAEAMLRPATYPEDAPTPGKMQALADAADRLGYPITRLPLAVSFADGVARTGQVRRTCRSCGDCITGCNHRAKNTVAETYLVDAHNHGAAIFAEVAVLRVAQEGWRWRVYVDVPGYGRDLFHAPPMAIDADVVILAAGALGSTEILLRSKEAGLPLSDRLGERFSGNGDVIGFGYNTARRVEAIGWGPADEGPVIGPLLTAMIDRSGQERLEDGMVIQDGAIPGALAGLAHVGLQLVSRALGEAHPGALRERVAALGRRVADLVGDDDDGALAHTTTYIVTSHDDSGGALSLVDDRLRITWPEVGLAREVSGIYDELRGLVDVQGGAFVPNPLWTKLTHNALITVHPLGGAAMADDARDGVVDERGRVFAGREGDAVHDGLYVCDGAIVPRSLGANPLLTICALAERQVALLAEDRGWQIAEGWPPVSPPEPTQAPLGVAFTEAMRGAFSLGEDDPAVGARRGGAEGSTLELLLTVFSRDLDALDRDPNHRSGMIGSALAPALSSAPLTVVDGTFDLFVDDLSEAATRNLRYRMQLHAEDGRIFFVDGYKVVRDDFGLDLWSDMTTLYTTIHEGPSAAGEILGKGILRVEMADFLRQLRSLTVLGRDLDAATKTRVLIEYGKLFGFALLDTYVDFLRGSRGPVEER